MPDGEPVRLTPTLSAGKPAWMPDSREFLFAARGGLWRQDALRGAHPYASAVRRSGRSDSCRLTNR